MDIVACIGDPNPPIGGNEIALISILTRTSVNWI
jgi:hypothetical protein